MKITITFFFIFACFVSKAYNHEIQLIEWEKRELTTDLENGLGSGLAESGIKANERHTLSLEYENLISTFSSDSSTIKEVKDQEKQTKIAKQASNEDEKASGKDKFNNGYGNRNIFAIGYQIGGWTLLGINYEIRFSDYVGAHFGIGLFGYTLGAKFHFNKDKNSSFINLSYKDGGFGLIQTIGGELGGRLPFSKNGDFGLHAQVGIGYITAIDSSFSSQIFDNAETPTMMLTFGIGFSW